MKRVMCFVVLLQCGFLFRSIAQKAIWQIGKADQSPNEFVLAPNKFRDFIQYDFGYEDKFFLIGHSKAKESFPYVLPGLVDTWGGTWPTSGWRTNQITILFGIKDVTATGKYTLVIRLADYAKKFLPLVKVGINNQEELIQLTAPGYDVKKEPTPGMLEPYVDTASITGNLSAATPKTIEIPINPDVIKKGGNKVTITVLQGSWIMFDQVQ